MRFASSGYAIATDDLDVNGVPTEIAGDVNYGRIRVQVTPRNDKPVFVGIARTEAVSSYLRHTPHSIVTDLSYDPFRADYRAQPGTEKPFTPGTQRIWAASSEGSGRQSITWNLRDGHWSVVVMNADGSRGVDAGVRAGARIPILDAIGWGAIGIGFVLLAGAGGLTALALRRAALDQRGHERDDHRHRERERRHAGGARQRDALHGAPGHAAARSGGRARARAPRPRAAAGCRRRRGRSGRARPRRPAPTSAPPSSAPRGGAARRGAGGAGRDPPSTRATRVPRAGSRRRRGPGRRTRACLPG